jgi:hypothetical protein
MPASRLDEFVSLLQDRLDSPSLELRELDLEESLDVDRADAPLEEGAALDDAQVPATPAAPPPA